MSKNYFQEPQHRLVIAVFVAFVALLTILLMLQTTTPTPQEESINQDTTVLPQEQIEITNTKQFQLGNQTISIPEGWNLRSWHRSAQGTEYKCIDGKLDCGFGILSNDGSNPFLTEVVLSYSKSVKSTQVKGLSSDRIDMKLNVAGEEVNLSAYKLKVGNFNSDGVPNDPQAENQNIESNLYSEIYGCNAVGICAYAYLRQVDPTANQNELSDLQYLLSNLVISQ